MLTSVPLKGLVRTVALLASVLLASGCCRSRSAPCCPRTAPVAGPAVVEAPGSRAAQPLAPIEVAGPGYRGVILTPKPGGWMPTPQQVAELEARLPGAMREWAPEFHKPLSEYFRQYMGRFEDGRRLIDVLGVSPDTLEFFETEGPDPRMEEMPIYGGGDSVIGAVYDPATRTFEGAGTGGES